MSTPTAKDLLAQADRLMRQRTPEELPVLTDLVIEEIEITSLTDRISDATPRQTLPAWAPALAQPAATAALPTGYWATPPRVSVSTDAHAGDTAPDGASALSNPMLAPLQAGSNSAASSNVPDVFGLPPRVTHDAPPGLQATSAVGIPNTAGTVSTTAAASTAREQFNAQLVAKLEEMQHGVYSQVMQQLEIYASGALKVHLRDTLLPVLTDIARDIAHQVAEDTSNQVREVVSKAVDTEIARLREQLAAKRRT